MNKVTPWTNSILITDPVYGKFAYFRMGDTAYWSSEPNHYTHFLSKLGLTPVPGSVNEYLLLGSGYQGSAKIQEWTACDSINLNGVSEPIQSEDITINPEYCNHSWEQKALFTGFYEKCSRCGLEKS